MRIINRLIGTMRVGSGTGLRFERRSNISRRGQVHKSAMTIASLCMLAFMLAVLTPSQVKAATKYSASPSAGTIGGNVLKLSATFNGTQATFLVAKQDGTTFSTAGIMTLRVGASNGCVANNDTYYKSYVAGVSSVSLTFDLSTYSGGYVSGSKVFYAAINRPSIVCDGTPPTYYSGPLTITANAPPSQPTISSTPASATLNTPVTISVTAGVDPEGTQVITKCTATGSDHSTPALATSSGYVSGGSISQHPFTFNNSGPQTIYCTSYDASSVGSTTTAQRTITVTTPNAPPSAPSISSSTPATIALNTLLNVSVAGGVDPEGTQVITKCTATGSDHSTPALATSSGYVSGGSISQHPFTFNSSGLQTIYCTSYDTNSIGSTSATKQINITLPAQPTLSGLSPDQVLTVGDTYKLQGIVTASSGDTLAIVTASVTDPNGVSNNTAMTSGVISGTPSSYNLSDFSNFTFNTNTFNTPGIYTIGIQVKTSTYSNAVLLKTFKITVNAPVTVDAVTSQNPTLGITSTFTVTGSNLKSGMAWWLDGCISTTGQLLNIVSTTTATFTCTPGQSSTGAGSGMQSGTIQASAGGAVLKSFMANIAAPTSALGFQSPLKNPGEWHLAQDFNILNSTFGGYHVGEDYVVDNGTEIPVYATASGTVKEVQSHTAYGYVVIIEHDLGNGNYVCSVYGHLRKNDLVAVGTVAKGQIIGYLSSNSTENGGYSFTHLHFGIRNEAYSTALDFDGLWRYRGYASSNSIVGLWYDPTDFVASHPEQTGYASVSALSISPSPILGQNFNIDLTLKEVRGASITFEQVVVAILDSNGTTLFNAKEFTIPQISIPANGSWSQTVTTSLQTTLSPGTYKVLIKGRIGGAWFDLSTTGSGANPVTFSAVQAVQITAPGAPTNVTAVAGDSQATISFSYPTNNGGSAITGYKVYRTPGNIITPGDVSPIIVSGLVNGTAYTFTVAATNISWTGDLSVASNSVTPKAAQSIGTISFSPATVSVNENTTVSATATSGSTVTFSSTTPTVCRVSGNTTVNALTAGLCTIAANQEGNSYYTAATQVTQSIMVNPAVINGACGNASIQPSGVVPTANLCTYGTPSAVTDNGSWVWTCNGSNGGSQASCSATKTTSQDTTSPALMPSTLPDNTVTNNATLNISGTVTDTSGIQSLTINSVSVTRDTNGNFSHAFTLVTGPNTITIIATDTQGNSVSDIRTIILDVLAPNLTITTPADNSKTAQPLATITGTISETSTVTVKVNNGAAQNASITGNNYSADITLANGLNTITITATDLAGNPTSAVRTVTLDITKPSLAITEPAQDITTAQSSITIGGNVADALTSVSVTISVDGQTHTPTVTNGLFSQTVTFSSENTYAITVTATDEAGNSTTVQRNIIYSNPAISAASLTLGAVSGSKGKSVVVPITLTNVTGTSLASVGMTIKFDTALLDAPSISDGAAATTAGKSASGSLDPADPGAFTLLVSAFNTTAIGNGIVANVTFPIKATATMGATTLTTVSANGSDTTAAANPVALTGVNGTITIISKPGDCDGSGVVSVAEVQSAINMYLKLKPVAGCVDVDGNGTVSVSEVQKTINAYLKLL